MTNQAGAEERPTHTISFRCSDRQFVRADQLRSTFDPPRMTDAFRWLLDTDEVRELIKRRANGDAS